MIEPLNRLPCEPAGMFHVQVALPLAPLARRVARNVLPATRPAQATRPLTGRAPLLTAIDALNGFPARGCVNVTLPAVSSTVEGGG